MFGWSVSIQRRLNLWLIPSPISMTLMMSRAIWWRDQSECSWRPADRNAPAGRSRLLAARSIPDQGLGQKLKWSGICARTPSAGVHCIAASISDFGLVVSDKHALDYTRSLTRAKTASLAL